MFKTHKEEIEINEKKSLKQESWESRWSCYRYLWRNSIIATAVGAKKLTRTRLFPLSVNYQKNFMQQVKFLVGILKMNQQVKTLISRLIDRPIRPLFPSGFMNEVQVLPTVLSYDGENHPDILSMVLLRSFSNTGLPRTIVRVEDLKMMKF